VRGEEGLIPNVGLFHIYSSPFNSSPIRYLMS
jgi:hypothetical protein